jgi:peptidoglycan LD-endopeptidase CwlK
MQHPDRTRRSLLRGALLLPALIGLVGLVGLGAADGQEAIVDSAMTWEEAVRNVNPKCPPAVLANQRLISVRYYSMDGRLHEGQLVVDRRVVKDVQEVFALALAERFPVEKVIPISHPDFLKNGLWDDDLSMLANNTSGFNYRRPTGGGAISNRGHAAGLAFDLNPRLNPYLKGKLVLPPGATYDPQVPGTLTARSPIVLKLKALGWIWGGDWRTLKDYQHFQKSNPGT